MSDIQYSDLETFCKEQQQEIAKIKNLPEEEVRKKILENAKKVFEF